MKCMKTGLMKNLSEVWGTKQHVDKVSELGVSQTGAKIESNNLFLH